MTDREVLQHLAAIESLLRALVKSHLAPILEKELAPKQMRILYGLTGDVTVTVLSKRLGFSAGKISAIWQKWEQQGLVIKEGKRYRKVFQ